MEKSILNTKVVVCFDPSNGPKSDAQFMACFRKDEHTFVVSRLMSVPGIKNFSDHGPLLDRYCSYYKDKDIIIFVKKNLGMMDEHVRHITRFPVFSRLFTTDSVLSCFVKYQQWLNTPNNKIEYEYCVPNNTDIWFARNLAYLICKFIL